MKKKNVLYIAEDNSLLKVEVLKDETTDEEFKYKVKLLRVLIPHAYISNPKPGEVLDVMQKRKMGAWGGMQSFYKEAHKINGNWFVDGQL